MDDSHIPKTVLYSETRDGSRKLGRPLLRHSDNSKRDMKLFDMYIETWEECALQRLLWRGKVTTGTKRNEEALLQRKEVHKQKRKQLQTSRNAGDDDDAYICVHCNKRYRSRIGLYSHIRTHRT